MGRRQSDRQPEEKIESAPGVIGLTGGIGSGKSTVAAMLAELGAYVVDADRVGHEVYEPKTDGWRRVVEAFGNRVVAPDGAIDRKALAAIVFADADALAQLNAIVHPLIRQTVAERAAAALAGDPRRPIVIEAAVLIEAKWYELVDEVWVVTADPEVVIARVTESRGLAADDVQARIDAQLSNQERCAVADVVIENNGTLEALRAAVAEVWRARG